MVDDIAVEELVSAIKPKPTDTTTTYNAVVSRIDEEGTVWVNIQGSEKETPTTASSSEVSRGDVVSVNWRNSKLYIEGNYKNPSAGYNTVLPSVNYVSELVQKNITANSINAATGFVDDLASKNITTESLFADHAMIKELDVESMSAATAYVRDLTTNNVTAQNIIADHTTVSELEADHVSVTDFEAEQANIDNLQAATADISTIRANSAKVQNLTAAELEADHATIGSLSTNYAQIDLANVDNAWIEDGVIKDGSIVNAMIHDVSANKLTAGTIDASNITVTNLNADNITTGTINGQRIGTGSLSLDKLSEDVYTETEVNTIVDGLNDRIDGAIETYTGTVIPTLNNTPASSWTTTKLKDQHVGDVYYVVNSSSEQNGYCYRFTKSGSTYSWQLIKDSDVTAALSRLETAEGKIGDIEAFDQTMTTFKTETEGAISTLQTKTTSLETSLGDKVDTTTFNELSQTVDGNTSSINTLTTTVSNKADSSTVTTLSNTVNEVSQTATGNSSKISSLTTTLGTNADGTTKTGDIVHRTSAVEQDLSGFKTTVSQTYQTKADMDGYATEAYADGKASDAQAAAIADATLKLTGLYATSSTAKGTTAKVATITPAVTGWTLYKGATITVKFVNENTATAPTLNVNSTGAKRIYAYTGTSALTEAEYKWKAGTTLSFFYDGSYWRIQDSTELTRISSAESSITQQASEIALKVNATDVYTKTQTDGLLDDKADESDLTALTTRVSTAESKITDSAIVNTVRTSTAYTNDLAGKASASDVSDLTGRVTTAEGTIETQAGQIALKANANDVYSKTDANALLEVKANKATLTSEINASADTVQIDANRVNIAGATIFTSGRLSETSLNNAYDVSGAATTAVNNLTNDLASASGTTVINGGHITTGSVSIGQINNLQSALNDAATKATNYLTTITGTSGISVHDANDTNNYVNISSSGVDVRKGGSSVAAFGDTARVGKESSNNIQITPDGGVLFYDNGVDFGKIQNNNGDMRMTSSFGDLQLQAAGHVRISSTDSAAYSVYVTAKNFYVNEVPSGIKTTAHTFTQNVSASSYIDVPTKTYSQSGFYPLGMVGYSLTGTNSTLCSVPRCLLTSRSKGSCDFDMRIRNTATAQAALTVVVHILWVVSG